MAGFEFGMLSLRIGRILVAEHDRPHWTYGIAHKVGVNRGSAHRVLRQFEENGWVDIKSEPGERPKTVRVLYLLTEQGFSSIREALKPFQIELVST